MDRSLYVESYTLYRNKLALAFQRRIFKVFYHLASTAFEQCQNKQSVNKHIKQFQNALYFISKWTPSEIEQEMTLFLKESNIEDMMAEISCLYCLQAKLLTAAKPGMQRHSISIDMMEPAYFLHQIYLQCARIIWNQAMLFAFTVPEAKLKQNHQSVHDLLLNTIHNTIDELIPTATIQRAVLEPQEDIQERIVTEYEDVASAAPIMPSTTFASASPVLPATFTSPILAPPKIQPPAPLPPPSLEFDFFAADPPSEMSFATMHF